MEQFEILAEKIHQAASEIVSLKKNNKQLLSELEILRKENHRLSLAGKEGERLKKEQDQLRTRLEKLNGKLEGLVSTDLALSFPK